MTGVTARAAWCATLGAICLGVALLAGCGGSESKPVSGAPSVERPAATADAAVDIQTFRFQPGSLHVAAGTRLAWTNRDQIEHTVTSGTPESRDGAFDAPLKDAGASFTFTFTTPGTYAYFCARHESMRGEVHVS
jgi:plastocyanin